MTLGEPQLPAPEQHPAVQLLEGFYSEAYRRQLNGENTLGISRKPGGCVETIALNPTSTKVGADNVRFLITTGGLDFSGYSIDTGNGELDVRYSIIKITLAPENTTPIQALSPDHMRLVALFYVNDAGQVSNGADWFSEEETAAMTSLMEAYELAPALPQWAQGSAV